MPHAGYAEPVMNDGPRFHSNISGKSSPNPSLEPSRYVLCQRVTQVDRTTQVVAERWVRRSRMPHAGYADFVMNDEPRFHSDISGKGSLNPSLEPSR